MNQERFAEPEKLFTQTEIELVQRLEKYNGFDIKSIEDVVSEIRGGDRTTIDYIADYYNDMKGGWAAVLNDPEIKLPVRAAIKEVTGKFFQKLHLTGLIKNGKLSSAFGKTKLLLKETMGRRLEVLEAGVLELMRQPGGIVGFIRETKAAQQPQPVTTINITDSVVIRSPFEIGGAQAVSSRKCPGCNREAESNEKFCPECGTGL